MKLALKSKAEIENPRGYGEDSVDILRELFADEEFLRSAAHADPQRPGFFEAEAAGRIFYFHVSPITGKVLLLACWPAIAATRHDCAAD